MKRILIIAILAMAIPSLALAQTNDKKVAPSSKAEQEVVKASGEIIEALGRTDVVMLDRIYADDFITDGFSLSSKAQLMDAWKSGRLKYTSAGDKDLAVGVYGDTAVTTHACLPPARNQLAIVLDQSNLSALPPSRCVGNHRFNTAVQLTTTVKGNDCGPGTPVCMRNRCPSGAASKAFP